MDLQTNMAVVAVSADTLAACSWWIWPVVLFFTAFIIGLIAVPAGVGGGVLFVPIISSFFPFNLDFVRSTGLMIALASALSAAPVLLRKNLASFRLAIPAALVASIFSIIGASLGLLLPNYIIQIAMGVTIMAIAMLFVFSKKSEIPEIQGKSELAQFLGIGGVYVEESTGKTVKWTIHRAARGYALFSLIGMMAGMFGLGAGWANVPVLNLLMGAPLKIAVGTSVLLLSVTDTTAAWIYINRGAVLPLLMIPCLLGMMMGSRLGVKLLAKARPASIRYMVIGLLFLAGLRSLLKGLGLWN